MKKIATLGALIALASTSAIADNDFYVKAAALGGWGHKLFDDGKKIADLTITKDMNKFGDMAFGGQLAFGYKIMDNVRVELQGYYFNGPKFKYTNELSEVLKQVYEKDELKVEASGPALMLGGAVDVVPFGPANLYVTAGAGISYMKVEVTPEIKMKVNDKAADIKKQEWDSKVRLAFNAGAGVSFAVSDSVNIDAGYLFTSLGKPVKDDFKTEKKEGEKDVDKLEWTGNSLMSHNVTVGVRFSF
jgi:opacity protein-like surface antigen